MGLETAAIMGLSSLLGAGLNLYAGGEQAKAAREAAEKVANASREAADKAWDIYLDQQTKAAPWLKAGKAGLNQLLWEMGIVPEGYNPYGTAMPKVPTKPDKSSFYHEIVMPSPHDPTQLIRRPTFDQVGYDAAMKSYNQAIIDLENWNKGITSAKEDPETKYGYLTSDFVFDPEEDPSYQFRLGKGIDALERSAAAHGRLGAGQTLKDLINYGQNFASTEYAKGYNMWRQKLNDEYNRLAGLAGMAPTAFNAGMDVIPVWSGLSSSAREALAAGDINAANAYWGGVGGASDAITKGVGSLLQYQLFDKYFKPK